MFSEPFFQIRPKLFYRVQVRRIRRKKEQVYAVSFGYWTQFVLSVETGVIHYNPATTRDCAEQVKLKPILEKGWVCRVFIGFWGKDIASAISGNYICAIVLSSALCILDLYAPQRSTVCSTVVLVAAAFVNINALLFWNFIQLFQVLFPLLDRFFRVRKCLFFSVIPIRFSA